MLASGAPSPSRASEPRTAFDKYLAAGDSALRADRYVEAEKMFAAAIAEAKKSDPQRLGLALDHLANLKLMTGDETKAAELRGKALAADQQALGPTDARVINDLANEAFFCSMHDQDAEAEKLFKQALELQDQNPEVSEYHKTNLLGNFCDLYMRQQRYAECEPLLERALEIIANSSRPWNSQEVVMLRHKLADVYRHDGKESEAQELENRAFEGIRQAGNPTLNSLQLTLEQADDSLRRGNTVAAEDAYREVIAATENKGGLRSDSMLYFALEGLGRLCAAGERDDEAEGLYLRAIEVRERNAMEGNLPMARGLGYLVPLLNLYQKQGRLFDMEPVRSLALAMQEKVLGSEDKAVADTLLLFAEVYRQEAKYQEALSLYARAAKNQEKNLGPSRQLAGTLGKYADLLRRLGEKDEADAVHARADAMLKQIGAQNPQRPQR
jgi:tetratricopeptide (TPR) repeat protein